MDYQQYLGALKRRWPYLIASIVIICGAVFYHVKTSPPVPVYQAESKIFVAAGVSHVSPNDVAQLAVSSQVAMNVMKDRFPQANAQQLESLVPILIRRMRADVGASEANRGGVVTIRAVAETREEAMRIVNVAADLAKDRALELTQLGTFKQGEYIGTELEAAEMRLQAARDAVQNFKERHNNLLIPLEFHQAMQSVNSLESQMRDVDMVLESNENRIRALKTTLGGRTEALDLAEMPSGAVIERLRGELAAKEVDLVELRMRYTDEHPDVKRSEQVIQTLTRRLENEMQKSFRLENTPYSLEYQFLMGDLARHEAEKMATQARRRAVESAAARAKAQLAELPAIEVEYNRLNLEFTNAQNRYMALRERMDQQRLAIHIAERQLEDKMGIGLIDYAVAATETPAYKFSKPKVKMAIALLVSIVVGIGVILLLEGMDRSIRDVDQMEDRYQLPVLGVIPMLKEASLKGGGTLVLRDSPDSPLSESYRIMRANFLALASQVGAKSVVMTSTLPGEGKTTTAANFASSLAEGHKRVILIDADMRNPSLHKAFGLRKDPGLSNYLSGESSLEDVIIPTSIDNLLLISAGTIPENPAKLLTSPLMEELLTKLGEMSDYVVIDTPPAVAFSDAMEIGSTADAMIVVVGAGSSLESAHFRARTQLANVKAVLVGTVLNRVQPTDVDSYRYSARYYPRLGSGKDKKGKTPAALPDGKS